MKKRLSLFLALMMALSLLTGIANAEAQGADVYFENGSIYTVDADDSIAEALAIKDGLIVFVGSAEEGKPYRDAAAEIVDLEGGMLLPGFIDGHIHTASPDFFDFSLAGIVTLDESIAAIESYVQANPDKEHYYGFGYMTSMFEGEEAEKGPRKERLDTISPDKPIIIAAFDGHAMWLNSKAFEMTGITKDTVAPSGGQVVKDDTTGKVWGTLRDSAMSLVPNHVLPDEQLLPALQEFFGGLNALGYTSILTLPGNGFSPLPLDGFIKMEEEGILTMRIRGAGIVTGWNAGENLETLKTLRDTYDTDLVKVTSAKFFADGVMDNESAHVLEGYASDPHNHGVTDWTQDDMNEAMAAVNALGLQVHTHAIGDAAVRMALDGIEYARANTAEGDYRNAITHLQLVADEDMQRFAALDVIAVVQPYWHFKQPDYWAPIEQGALGERAEHEYPMQSFLDEGVLLAFASDFPVTVHPYPFVAIETAVTRNLSDGEAYGVADITDMDDPTYLLWPEERISLQEAIRGFTASGAYAIFAEDVTGTLEVGKSADMIVIDRDLFAINPVDISETVVLRTYLQGEVVFDISMLAE